MDWIEGIFAPGWVWSVLGLVLVIGSLVGIYRQLRTAGAANAIQRIETLQGTWNSPELLYARLVAAVHVRSGHADMTGFFKAQGIVRFFLNLDDLEEAGYLSRKEIYTVWGPAILNWMALLAPTMEVVRRDRPGSYPTEALVAKLRSYERGNGLPPVQVDPEALKSTFDFGIDLITAIMEQEHDRVAGRIPTVPRRPSAEGAMGLAVEPIVS